MLLLLMTGCSGNRIFHRMVREDWGTAGGAKIAVLPVSKQGDRLLREMARYSEGAVFSSPELADILVEVRQNSATHLLLLATRRASQKILLSHSWIVIDDSWSANETMIEEFARDFGTNYLMRVSRGARR